ncbi:alpha/beta fold hydrolase [Nocardia fluminea]|uniref:esterase/lipase family protein n=1 Tax=Nocardia fluminea TaxID=134984 RepID=UPI00340A02C5
MRLMLSAGIAAAYLLALTGISPAIAEPVTPPAAPTAHNNEPVFNSITTALAWTVLHPDAIPAGANQWDCVPSPAHPNPVVLLHGTWANAFNNWSLVSATLKNKGYCVFAPNYGLDRNSVLGMLPWARATGEPTDSAKQVAAFVDQVLTRTGAPQVDLVGHSQGVAIGRQYMRFEGGTDPADPTRNKVAKLISIAGPNAGTTLHGVENFNRTLDSMGIPPTDLYGLIFGRSILGFGAHASFIANLNANGQTDPGVAYTTITTRYDELLTPIETTFLTAGPDATVNRVILQDGCELDYVEHANMTYDPRVIHFIAQALDPTTDIGPAPCEFVPPVILK